MNLKLTPMQIFSIAAIIIFVGSMVFMYSGQGRSSVKENVTYNQGTVLGNASFFGYKSYLYFDISQNITDSLKNEIKPYIDYIDYNKGIISIKDSGNEIKIYKMLRGYNLTVYIPTEFILMPEATLVTSMETTNMTLDPFKFEMQTQIEFNKEDMVSVSIPAVIRNNQIVNYGNPQMQVFKKKINVSAKVVMLKGRDMTCYINWQDQFKLDKDTLARDCGATSNNTLNINGANYFYVKSPIGIFDISSLKNMSCVSNIHEQTVYLKDNCTPNVTGIYNLLNKSNMVFPTTSIECINHMSSVANVTVGNAILNGTSNYSCGTFGLNSTKEDINYVYSIQTSKSDGNSLIDYLSKKQLVVGSIVNTTIDVYTSGNKILPNYQ